MLTSKRDVFCCVLVLGAAVRYSYRSYDGLRGIDGETAMCHFEDQDDFEIVLTKPYEDQDDLRTIAVDDTL